MSTKHKANCYAINNHDVIIIHNMPHPMWLQTAISQGYLCDGTSIEWVLYTASQQRALINCCISSNDHGEPKRVEDCRGASLNGCFKIFDCLAKMLDGTEGKANRIIVIFNSIMRSLETLKTWNPSKFTSSFHQYYPLSLKLIFLFNQQKILCTCNRWTCANNTKMNLHETLHISIIF